MSLRSPIPAAVAARWQRLRPTDGDAPAPHRAAWWAIARTAASRGANMAALLLVTMLTTRALGPAGRGHMAAAYGWVTLFGTLGYLSLSQVIAHRAARERPGAWVAESVGSLLAITAVATLVGWGVAASAFFVGWPPLFTAIPGGVLAAAFAGLPLLLLIESSSSILIGLGRLDTLNRAVLAGAGMSVLATVVAVVVLDGGAAGGIAGLLAANVVLVYVALRAAHAAAGRFRPTWAGVRRLLHGGAQLHVTAVASFLSAQAGTLILSRYRPGAEVGQYHLALQLTVALQLLSSAMSTVGYAKVTELGPDAAWTVQRRLLMTAIGATTLLGVVGAVFAPLILRLVGGAAFLPAVPILRLLLLTTVGAAVSAVMASQWIARGLFLQVSATSLVCGAGAVVANLLLVPRHGAVGAAWAAVGTYALGTLINLGLALRLELRWRRAARP